MSLFRNTIRPSFLLPLAGYCLLAYLVIQLPIHLYEPTSAFDLPGFLWFTHLILLYIHEAGHLIFRIFGRTVSILGGSLMQVIAPAAWFVVAMYEGSRLTNVALVFTGVSLVDVSIYIKDAELLRLPLIGGLSKAHHDWRNLLNGWDMLDWSFPLGETVFWAGMALGIYGIAAGIVAAWKESRLDPSV